MPMQYPQFSPASNVGRARHPLRPQCPHASTFASSSPSPSLPRSRYSPLFDSLSLRRFRLSSCSRPSPRSRPPTSTSTRKDDTVSSRRVRSAVSCRTSNSCCGTRLLGAPPAKKLYTQRCVNTQATLHTRPTTDRLNSTPLYRVGLTSLSSARPCRR